MSSFHRHDFIKPGGRAFSGSKILWLSISDLLNQRRYRAFAPDMAPIGCSFDVATLLNCNTDRS